MKRYLSLLLGAGLLSLVAGCGQTPTLTVQLGTATISIVRGEQDTIAVTVTRGGGAADPVALSVSGAPANVSATFADSTIAAGASATTLQLDVAAAAAEGTNTLTIQATSGSLAATADLTLDVTSLTVNGTVHGVLGDGFAGAKVAIQGNTATTDATGAFTIAGVSVPYDIAVGTPVSSGAAGQLYVGFTTATPSLTPYGPLAASSSTAGYYPTATIHGDLSSAVPAGSEATVCAEGIGIAVYGCDSVSAGNTAYSITAKWAQGSSVSFTLHALVTQFDADHLPTGYDAYGTASGSTTDGATTSLNVSLGAAPATTTLTLSANPPAGFTGQRYAAGAELSSVFTMPVFASNGTLSTSITVPVPQFSGATYAAFASSTPSGSTATSLGWKQGIAAPGSATFTLPAPAAQVSPAAGATGIGVGDTLQVAATGGAPVTFLIADFATAHFLAITTMSDTATIPDLTDVGAPLLPSHTYTWVAYLSPTATTVEQAGDHWLLDYYGALLGISSGGPGSLVDEGTIASSDGRAMTTP